MAVVVEQTLPFPTSSLDLDNSERWSRLFPLIRPTVSSLELSQGQTLLVDRSQLHNDNVNVVAIGSTGNFSSTLLHDRGVAAFATQKPGGPAVSIKDIYDALQTQNANLSNGLVVLSSGSRRYIDAQSSPTPDLVAVDLEGELEFDHVLSLLSAVETTVKLSLDKTVELLKIFLKSASKTTTTFDVHKSGSNPTVKRQSGTATFESAKSTIEKELASLLRTQTAAEDPVVYSVHYADVNGLARLESYILAHEISSYLTEQNLRSYITSSTILNSADLSRGWTISICALPTSLLSPQSKPPNTLTNQPSSTAAPIKPLSTTPTLQFSDAAVRQRITSACNAVIASEATITSYDTIVGDGDCGYTLRDGAKQVLSFIETSDLSALPQTLAALVDDLEVNMGGTSGALYCIFLSSLAQQLYDAATLADALAGAQDHLLKYTRARKGDRTMLDCLIPFVETWQATGDVRQALEEASKGVEGTKQLEAKLGRSTYLDEAATQGVPDPGAFGLLKLLEGMVEGK
ncbi:MAG: Dihydroxyacetone kinase 2 [Piccolia ochrophora]|nr:MAG: Dihydroxyacetone kinase 2 [Piccolia ochrophora]